MLIITYPSFAFHPNDKDRDMYEKCIDNFIEDNKLL